VPDTLKSDTGRENRLSFKGIRRLPGQLRRATLYPAELRVRGVHLADWPGAGNGLGAAVIAQNGRLEACWARSINRQFSLAAARAAPLDKRREGPVGRDKQL
jgi:hypothetical protein